jgi:hypothetical protein
MQAVVLQEQMLLEKIGGNLATQRVVAAAQAEPEQMAVVLVRLHPLLALVVSEKVLTSQDLMFITAAAAVVDAMAFLELLAQVALGVKAVVVQARQHGAVLLAKQLAGIQVQPTEVAAVEEPEVTGARILTRVEQVVPVL